MKHIRREDRLRARLRHQECELEKKKKSSGDITPKFHFRQLRFGDKREKIEKDSKDGETFHRARTCVTYVDDPSCMTSNIK
jgi:hypothetical protein